MDESEEGRHSHARDFHSYLLWWALEEKEAKEEEDYRRYNVFIFGTSIIIFNVFTLTLVVKSVNFCLY